MRPRIDASWYVRPEGVRSRLTSGGVVVRRPGDGVLVALGREHDWRQYILPKGGVDPGESVEAAARREIEEEVGLSQLRLVESLGVSERLSFDKTLWLEIHYFLYQTEQVEGRPTDTEYHQGMWWFPIDDLPEFVWPEQRRLVEDSRALIAARLG
ncbi:MAG: NUDIX domain-containing protein [Candidatus Latescibacteria bacterium]|nr:NUDIX domain-containing protein [Candidatus Latescibacterota bacterium]